MRSERQALDDIAALKIHDPHVSRWIYANEVRAILADVQPEPAPASGTIDREALESADRLSRWIAQDSAYTYPTDGAMEADLRRVLALVRPVEGVVLTREEAWNAHAALNYALGKAVLGPTDTAEYGALVKRLEATS